MTAGALRTLKVCVFLVCLVPLGKLALELLGVAGLSLGANPVEELIHRFGIWGLNFLMITLAVTPLRFMTGKNWLIRFRRMLGLFAFFYVLMHFLVYAGLDQGFDLSVILEDVVERPYITVGFTALLLLIPLAVTSTNRMMKRLGRRWQKLHRLVYPIAVLAVWHFYWQVKLDTLEPIVYIAILSFLLGYRFWRKYVRSAHPR
ncbi:MAG: sulfoxide reductase heme-binding subunit YedZ [Xanthomonadales bacterium]|nr:sulfoxide reductase heme-binding subunit YedZ [Gammaproteobacteria bacterium]MBT8053955.1 sulfoxide reductase heme-binding subunit YedZ [Gammaproteobacteria bacterium]NND58296.1 sulfoxide reductase heme-binding subunit YedZ [Xanthomonadales bacterium]NNK51993.1 sulfoxide reductase heme-binding subunit YedZ [Xanthomonadales bacterium]